MKPIDAAPMMRRDLDALEYALRKVAANREEFEEAREALHMLHEWISRRLRTN